MFYLFLFFQPIISPLFYALFTQENLVGYTGKHRITLDGGANTDGGGNFGHIMVLLIVDFCKSWAAPIARILGLFYLFLFFFNQ